LPANAEGGERACDEAGFAHFTSLMAKTATATAIPLPQPPAREQARGYRNASIEERTAILETRWEETVPTLATSKDISDLRGEMRNLENRLIKWVIGAAIALVAVFVALLTANTQRIDAALAELKADSRSMNARIDRLDEKIDTRFDALMVELREQRAH